MILVDAHRAELQTSGLTDETIARAGIFSAPERQVRDLLGYGAGAGLVFPYRLLNGSAPYARVKLDKAGADGKRYRSPAKQPNRLYVPALVDMKIMADPSTSLWLTEGEKKALKACQEGLRCLALAGVWSWRTRNERDQSVPIPDLDHVVWRGRTVYIVFDSDLAANSSVKLAEFGLARELGQRGARALAVRLPGGPNGQKVGLDDFLTTHSVETLCAIEPVEIRDPATVAVVSPPAPGPSAAVWTKAKTAAELLEAGVADVEWLDFPLVARGAITEVNAPRGTGKSIVVLARVVALARTGARVLYLDRDNSPTTLRKRLHGLGARGVATLRVLTRETAPRLADAVAWAAFPLADYDAIVLDAWDAFAEGAGEQDSRRSTLALAPLLDVVRRERAPGVILLCNVTKDGAAGRGSGTLEDRADVVYEARDATGFTPTGRNPWWEELPPAARGGWGGRATRRSARDRPERIRVAFIASKFRDDDEPAPFALEVDFTLEPWVVRDVTAELIAAGDAARADELAQVAAAQERAAGALISELARRDTASSPPLLTKPAEALLVEHGLKRRAARELLKSGGAGRWRLEPRDGRSLAVVACVEQVVSSSTAAQFADSAHPHEER